MAYSDNPAVNDTCLSVINDGTGAMCGYPYAERVRLAQEGMSLHKFREMARNYGRYRVRVFDCRNLTRPEWVEAGDIIARYYDEHVKEGA